MTIPMTESRIERVARAMWEARAAHFGEVVMPMAKDERYELFKSYARAAIAAMEQDEPTEEMIEAGYDTWHRSNDWKDGRDLIAKIYRTMRAR